jgi:hypothetical protein
MLEEVSRALNELAAIIARLQYIEAELLRAKTLGHGLIPAFALN